MKELTIEQKAKAYDLALERAKKWLNAPNIDKMPTYGNRIIEEIFPELIEEYKDEKIRKELIKFVKVNIPNEERYIAWLEKQGNIDKVSCEIAEKEKYDFVSRQFIECRKSFNEFKEGNSYWFEYVGNDTYIGRSDNVLNKKFHITPRQLYCLFTQQHCPKENNVINEGTNVPTAYGKYVDECLNEAAKHFFSEGEDKYSVADLFYAGVRCGQSWLENKGQTFTKKEVDDAYLAGVRDAKQELEKQGEQKPAWSREDDNKVKEIIEYLDAFFYNYSNDYKTWFNSLKDRVQPQPKQEWSEEDENILEAITYTVKNSGYSHCIGVSIKVMIDWLETIKQKIVTK